MLDSIVDQILLMLDIDATDDTNIMKVQQIVKLVAKPVLLHLGVEDIPLMLDYVVIELALARYNRIGAEGYSEEKNDNIQNRFVDNLFEQYIPVLDKWKEDNVEQVAVKKVKFF